MRKNNLKNMSQKWITEIQCSFKTIPHRETYFSRLNWASARRNWITIDCGKVMLSDESSFTLSPTKLRARVWRKEGTRYNPSNLVPTLSQDTFHYLYRVGFQFMYAHCS